MDMKIKEKNIPENLVVLKEVKNLGLNNALYELFEWAKERKIRIHGVPFSIFPDFPDESTQICGLSVRGENLESCDDIIVKTLDEHLTLSSIHVGPYDNAFKTYNQIVDFAEDNNYIVSGSTYLVFINNPFYTEKEHLISEVQVTVKKQ